MHAALFSNAHDNNNLFSIIMLLLDTHVQLMYHFTWVDQSVQPLGFGHTYKTNPCAHVTTITCRLDYQDADTLSIKM